MTAPRSVLALAPALALALTLAIPAASAHFEDTNLNAASLRAGPYLVAFEPKPSTVFAGAPTTLATQVVMPSGLAMRDHEGDVTVVVAGPGPFSAERNLTPDSSGWFVGAVSFPATGVYSATFTIRDTSGGAYSNSTTLDVYPDLPVRIRPIDAALDVFTNRSMVFDVEVVNATFLTRVDDAEDLSMRFEHWSDGHDRKLGEEIVTARRTGMGTWRGETDLGSSGMYHIRFASSSGGFNYDETPPLHIYAMDPLPGEDDGADDGGARTPGPGIPLLVLALGAAILLARKR